MPFRRGAVRNRHRATQLTFIVDVSWSFHLPHLQDPSPSSGLVSNWRHGMVATSSCNRHPRASNGFVSHGGQTVPNSLVTCPTLIPRVLVVPRAWDPDRSRQTSFGCQSSCLMEYASMRALCWWYRSQVDCHLLDPDSRDLVLRQIVSTSGSVSATDIVSAAP